MGDGDDSSAEETERQRGLELGEALAELVLADLALKEAEFDRRIATIIEMIRDRVAAERDLEATRLEEFDNQGQTAPAFVARTDDEIIRAATDDLELFEDPAIDMEYRQLIEWELVRPYRASAEKDCGCLVACTH